MKKSDLDLSLSPMRMNVNQKTTTTHTQYENPKSVMKNNRESKLKMPAREDMLTIREGTPLTPFSHTNDLTLNIMTPKLE